jgi:hypothetical protein
VSSAYCKQGLHSRNGMCINFRLCNFVIHEARKSIAKLNKYDDMGSPYLTPLLSQMDLPATELMIILDTPDNTRCCIHEHKSVGNPLAFSMSKRNCQTKMSKALCMSALNSNILWLEEWAACMACCA